MVKTMSVKGTLVLNDEDGFLIMYVNGHEFISTEPIEIINGKFKASALEKLVFVEA